MTLLITRLTALKDFSYFTSTLQQISNLKQNFLCQECRLAFALHDNVQSNFSSCVSRREKGQIFDIRAPLYTVQSKASV